MKSRKYVISFVLIIVLALSLTVGAGAATARIDGFGEQALDEEMFEIGQNMNCNSLEVHQGDELRIPLTQDMFSWSDGRVMLTKQAISVHQLRGVKVRMRRISGTKALDYVQFDTDTFSGTPFHAMNSTASTGRTAYISVMVTREFVGVDDLDFEYEIFLLIGRDSDEEHTITLSGTLLVVDEEVDAETDYVNMVDGIVAEATEYVPKIDMDTGNGLTITTNLMKDKRYYATSKIVDSRLEMKDELDYLPDLYPEIEAIYKLETVNLTKGGSTRAKIEFPYADAEEKVAFHVYSEDLQYLGTTADELAFSPMYILTTQRIPALEEIDYENVTKEKAKEKASVETETDSAVKWTPKEKAEAPVETEAVSAVKWTPREKAEAPVETKAASAVKWTPKEKAEAPVETKAVSAVKWTPKDA